MIGITHFCFGLSYLTAFGLQVGQSWWPRSWLRWTGQLFGVAGLLAHTIYLVIHQPTPAMPYGSLLLLAWVFAVFYLYGNLHPHSNPWTMFVLPLVLILVWLSYFFLGSRDAGQENWFSEDRFWGMAHGSLVLIASVGIMIAFLASVMYLIQSRRLRQKKNPLGGLKLGSLERLEMINRRGVTVAFPFLTIGLLLGMMRSKYTETEITWTELKVVSTVCLWGTALLLMYLRYGVHLPPRRLALLTIAVFGVLLLALFASHPFAPGEPR